MSATLLPIEDDDDSADALEAFLSLEGYTVRWARTGREALQAIGHPPGDAPALVLMDLTLPDMSGVELGRRIRQLSRVPIVILSARELETMRDVATELGAVGVLRKPYDLSALRSVIERALHQPV